MTMTADLPTTEQLLASHKKVVASLGKGLNTIKYAPDLATLLVKVSRLIPNYQAEGLGGCDIVVEVINAGELSVFPVYRAQVVDRGADPSTRRSVSRVLLRIQVDSSIDRAIHLATEGIRTGAEEGWTPTQSTSPNKV